MSFSILATNHIISTGLARQGPVRLFTLVTLYRSPGPYTDFLSEFSDFLSTLVINSDKILMVGDFNIQMDNGNNSLTITLQSLVDSIGFYQHVNASTHYHNHIIYLVLTYGLEIDTVAPLKKRIRKREKRLTPWYIDQTLTNYSET